ncbi:MAG: CAP domain-containing protein [Actinomycetota bacterium]
MRGNWQALGENVGVGGDVEALHRAFMDSPGHRTNFLGDYERVGIGRERRSSSPRSSGRPQLRPAQSRRRRQDAASGEELEADPQALATAVIAEAGSGSAA